MREKLHLRARLHDIATVRYGKDSRSVTQGYITMISYRGINIRTDNGELFVKWCNVMGVECAS